jgi:hypothetical protein
MMTFLLLHVPSVNNRTVYALSSSLNRLELPYFTPAVPALVNSIAKTRNTARNAAAQPEPN